MFSRFSKILIVDDSAIALTILRALLRKIGLENVEEAADGQMALAMLNRQSFRLVISDWDMGPMDGLELLQAMRADVRLARIPFIMATVQAHKKFVDIARDNGATHYLVKPYTAETLADRISRIGRMQVAEPVSA